MQVSVFAVMVAVGMYSLDRWAVKRVAVYPMTLLSASIWSWLALRGTSLTSNMQGPHTEAYPYLGYVFLFLALASLLAMIAHYLWGLPRTGDREEAANASQTETED